MQFLSWLLILGSTLIVVHAEHNVEKRDTTNQKKVVCYYTNWSVYRPGTAKFSPQNINPYLCTHLIYAFGGLDKENGLRPYDKYQDIEQGGYAKFNGLKTYNKNLKTLLAIGGWNEGSARFSKLVDDPDKRKEFVKNVIKFLRQNNFDGLDLDWEYPAYRDGSNPSDKENYAFLVKELREEFNRESSKTGRPRLLLTMAVPAGIEYIDKGYDVPELNKHLDFINLLTYDYHSSYEPAVNHHSPLYPLEEDSEYNFEAKLNIDHTIKHYIAAGADKDKLILGIPTYGRSYTLFNNESTDIGAPSDGPGEKGEATREKGYLAYYEICGNLKKDDKWTVEQPKPRAMGPYAYKENQWVGYDDQEFVKLKAKYANENDLGGIMFWSIDNDDFRGNCHSKPYPLIEAGKEALFGDSKNEYSQEKETKTALKSRPKPRPNLRTTTSAPKENAVRSTTTPEPPTTPDTGTDFTCKDEGFFPHPRECKKYFWCLDSGPSNLGIVAHQFTCPSGLVFNKVSDSCDYSRNVICKDKKTSTETTTTTTTTPKPTKPGIKITTTTTSTTTTTTHIPEVQEEVEDELEEEDPKEIKQLIDLIKKLGGVAELEKQLNIKDGSTEVTTPAISKSLYNKVLKIPSNKYQSSYINGPGPQSEGLDYKDENVNYRKDKPQYVTIRRQRPSKDVVDNTKEEEEEDTPASIDTSTERFKPKYKTFERTRYRDLGEVADETSENDSLPKYTTISRTRSTESELEETTSPKYVTLRRQRPVYREEESNEEENTSVSTTASTLQTPRYVSLLRQRSTTTVTTPLDDSLIETKTRDTAEEPKEKKTNKVSNGVSTTEPNIISTNLSDYEPLITEIITTTINVPTNAILKSSETTPISTTTVSEQKSDTTSTTIAQTLNVQNDSYTPGATKIPTSTITNVVTSVYEAATERQRVRVKNIQNFLLEHKKTEPVTQLSIAQVTTTSPVTIKNMIATEEPTQKSILKGRFGGPAHIRPTLRKPSGTSEKIPETTTEEKIVTTTEKLLRSYSYVNRFIRPAKNSTERAIVSTTSRRFIRPTTESASELNTRQFNRFRSTTTKATNYEDTSAPFTRRNSSRFKSSTINIPSTTVTEIPKSRFFRNRRPVSSTSTTTEMTSEKELLNLEENAEHVRYEMIAYAPTTSELPPVTNFEGTSKGEVQITTFDSFEPTKYDSNETTTIQPSSTSKVFRGSVRANSLLTEDDPSKKSRTSGRHNSRFLKDEQKILFIRILPPPDGSRQSDFTSPTARNVTRNRGKIRAFDSLELNTLNDGLTDNDRPNDLFRGSETKFRIRPSTAKSVTAATSDIGPSTAEEVQRDRTRHRIARPVQRTTTTTTEESVPIPTTESYASKANRRRKFRPEYKSSTTTLSYEEEPTTPRTRNPERKFRSRTTVLKSPIVTSSTTETLEENDKNTFSSSSQPYYDDSSLFGKTRDDRKIGGSAEDLANTAVVAINTLAKSPPLNNEFRSSTHVPQQGVVRGEPTQKRVVDFEPRTAPPHAKSTTSYDDNSEVRSDAARRPALARSPEPAVDRPPAPFQPVPFQPSPFQPSPFQAGPFQPLPYPAIPLFQTNDAQFAPAQPPPAHRQQQAQRVATTAHPQATSRQTFVLRRGPPPPVSRTTPLLQPAVRPTAAVPPPQYPVDGSGREQFADYSELQAPPPLEQRVALKGKVRIHGDGYIECLDVGSFPHPFSCQKFISCAKTEYGSLFGWEYTCPKGLAFDQVGGICNWSAGPACNNNN